MDSRTVDVIRRATEHRLYLAARAPLARRLARRRWLAALLGAAGGPLSFRAGAALGAVHFAQPMAAFCALALGWSVILPASLWLAERWDGMSGPASPLDRQQ
ncbi:DUF2878 family protein [Paraburkholderia sp. J69-1]|uniref:DUF2878 family protein n=1 Tax=unclassified Paraburkholderia TaxID=2615204 RepID=UPI0039F14582